MSRPSSDESPQSRVRRSEKRRPSPEEVKLLEGLSRSAAGLREAPDWIEHLLVENLDDGGMGSLCLWPRGVDPAARRRFGAAVAESQHVSDDGVTVLVTLYVDREARPFELDVWRTDFSPRR